MIKILFVAPRLHTNQYSIIESLIKSGKKIFFNSIYKGKIENYNHIKPIIFKTSVISKILENFFKPRDPKNLYFPKIIDYYFFFKKIQPDIVIIRTYGRFFPYLSAIFARIFRSKIIFYEQAPNDFSHLSKKNTINFFKKVEFLVRNYIFNSILITPLKYTNKFKKNCFYLPFAVNVEKKIRIKKIKKFKILIISKFQERKSIYLALEVFKKLANKYNFRVSIVGEVSCFEHRSIYDKCHKFIASNKLEKKITLYKNIDNKKIKNFYSRSNLFVLPAHSEPASISILEALGYGLPVVCSDTCGTKCYLRPNFSQIFKSKDSYSLEKKIKFFLDSKEKYNFFSKNAHSFAKKNLSKENYSVLFEKLISNKLLWKN